MQNLILKLLVLMGVIGGSCFVVYQAHEGLQSAADKLGVGEFVEMNADHSAATTAPAAPTTAEPEPTLAATAPTFPDQPAEKSLPASNEKPIAAPQQGESAELPLIFSQDSPASAPKQTEQPEHPLSSMAANQESRPVADPFVSLPDQKIEHPEDSPRKLPALPQPAPLNALAAPAQTETPEPMVARESPSETPSLTERFGPAAGNAPAAKDSSEPAAVGMTRLPPEHPGPVLLPVPKKEDAAISEFPGRVITAEAQEVSSESPSPVLPVSGTAPAPAPRPFMGVPEQPGEKNTPSPVLPDRGPQGADPFADGSQASLTSPAAPSPAQAVVSAVGEQREKPKPVTVDVAEDPFALTPASAIKPAAQMPPLPPMESSRSQDRAPLAAAEVLPESLSSPARSPSSLPETPNTPREPAPRQLPTDEVLPTPVQPTPTPATLPGLPVSGPATGTETAPHKSSIAPLGLPEIQPKPSALPDATVIAPAPALPSIEPAKSPATNQLIGTGDADPAIPRGPQSPELKIEKIAPAEAVLGEPLVYSIVVRNVGGSPARDVTVEDRIPRGAQLEGTIPQALLNEGKLTWTLGTLPPGEERKIQLKVVPLEPGQIGSVATVSFAAAVSASITITAPKLTIKMEGPSEVTVGEQLTYRMTLKNLGQGIAKSVYLRAILPPGFRRPGGNDLEYEAGAISPGGEKIIDLTVIPEREGVLTPVAQVSNDGKTHAETRADVNVLKSRLELVRTGPENRFVGRPAACVTQVINRSTAPLFGITVQEKIPQGLELAGIPQAGQWDPRSRLITWTIPQLGPGEAHTLQSEIAPATAGEMRGSLIALDKAGNRVELETLMHVKGFAELDIDVTTPQKTVVKGERVSVRMSVKNDGTAAARDVHAKLILGQGLQFVAAHGPVDYQLNGSQVQFASLEAIPVGTEQTFDVSFIANEPGSTKVTMQLENADYEEPLLRDHPLRVISTGQ